MVIIIGPRIVGWSSPYRAHDDDVVSVRVQRNANLWFLPWEVTLIGRTPSGWPYTIDSALCMTEAKAIRVAQKLLARERIIFQRRMAPRWIEQEE